MRVHLRTVTTAIAGLALALLSSTLTPGLALDSYQQLIDLHAELQALDLNHLTELTDEVFENRATRLPQLKQKLADLDASQWEISRRIDFLLVFSELSQLYFEHAVLRPWRRDPGFYVDRISRIPFAELPLKGNDLERFKAQVAQVPAILDRARANLNEGSGELARLALRNLEHYDGVGHGYPLRAKPPEGVVGWYQDLLGRVQTHHPEAAEEAQDALRAVEGFRDWLSENAPKWEWPAGVGSTHYDWYLRNVRLMPFKNEDVITLGERELQRSLSSLALEQWRNRDLPELLPAADSDDYTRRIREADKKVRDFIRTQRILTLPAELGSFGHNVPWTTRPGGRLNFWEAVQFRDPLPDHVHAVIPGHRFDTLLHRRDQRPIRKDFADSGRIEGWAFYLEETMLQLGLLQDRPRTRELYYIFQAARAVRNRAEIEMQLNRWNVAQAVQYMMENVPLMDEDVARVDCEIYLRRPGYGISYSIGKIQIEQLMADRKRQLKDGFELDVFHDRFLASGWIPISLIRWEMTGLEDQISTYSKLLAPREE